MSKQSGTKPYLVEQLKQQHCLWSYDCNSIQDIPDDVLIELVMLYLDIDEINMLFSIFSCLFNLFTGWPFNMRKLILRYQWNDIVDKCSGLFNSLCNGFNMMIVNAGNQNRIYLKCHS